MFKLKIIPLALLIIGNQAIAQQVPVTNGQMQQIPTVPKLQAIQPKLAINKQTAPAMANAEQIKIVVKTLSIKGARAYSEAELIAVTGFQVGTELNLNQLQEMAARISRFYHQHGYFAAQAYLPAQDIRDGNLSFMVMEGHYGKINLRNQSNVSDSLLQSYVENLREKDVITAPDLEHSLLLLSDLPGIKINSVLAPGSNLGESNLAINVEQGPRLSGSVDVDNAGNRYTGEYRYGLTLNLNEPLGMGDIASLRALTSGDGLRYARASYQMQLGKLKAGVAYSALEYELGEEFESLGAHGSTKVSSVFLGYPLIRSRDTNLYGQLGFDAKVFKGYVDAVGSVADKKSKQFVASLYGDFRGTMGAGTQTNYSLSLTAGEIDLQSPVLRSFDAITAKQNGHFNKLNFSVTRLQNLSDSLGLYGSLSGQFASKNLDVSEKMELGGMYAVRAYPEGEAFADQGVLANLELRWQPPFQVTNSSQLQLSAFVDAGRVDINKNPWTQANNHRSLSGAGLGVSWSDYNNFVVKAYYAKKLGNEQATSAPDKSGRFWIQAVKYF
jgi:hemolysin activation/secretion protein